MKINKYILFFTVTFLLSSFKPLVGQPPEERISRTEYIDTYKEIAIVEMNAFHIPASITLAQGILESGNGNSGLAKNANNHFGIKCHKGWTGESIRMDDDEKNECFRKYRNAETSFKDHSQFLTTRSRYAFLFELKITDYESWAKGLKKAGYATNPKYPQLLIKIIKENKLYEFDKFYGKKYSGSSNKKKQSTSNNFNTPLAQKQFKEVPNSKNNRKIYLNNGVKFTYAKKGDTFYEIAKEFNIYSFQVYRYNDMKKKDIPVEGQIIYLQSKKSNCNNSIHNVQPGETLFDISQEYGIKIKKLAKYNNLRKDATLYPDQKLKLNK